MANQTRNWDPNYALDESYELYQIIMSKWSHKPLHAAVQLKQEEIARMLIVGGIDIEKLDEEGNTALHLACIAGNYNMARILTTQYGAPITQKYLDQLNGAGRSCLHIAAYKNRWDIVHSLVNEGASIDVREAKTGGTPLHTAVAFNNKSVIKFIINCCKPNLQIKNYAGKTAGKMVNILLLRMP